MGLIQETYSIKKQMDYKMKKLTFEPDEHMKWIYDPSHPRYNSEEAKDLRNRRASALSNLPNYMRVYDNISSVKK